MPTLQEMVSATPSGGTCDLGTNKTYEVGQDPLEEYPFFLGDKNDKLITVVGDGCHIVAKPTKLDHRPTMMVRGRTKLLGDVTVHGYEDTETYDDHKAFKHCIELQGPQSFESTWNVVDTWGAGIQVGKRVIQGKPSRWTKNLWLHDYKSSGHKKQHVAVNNLEGGKIENYEWRGCRRSALDIEPPGSDSGCRNLYYGPGDIYAPFTFVLANLGAGTNTSCQDITLDGVRCHGQAFGVRVVPVTGKRRQRYTLKNCSSDVRSSHPMLTFWNVDGIVIRNISQPMTQDVELARFNSCTGIDVDCTYVSG